MPEGNVIEKEEVKQDQKQDEEQDPQEPPKFKVLLHNDDYTTFRFVVRLLTTVFRKSEPEAERITKKVHNTGIGVAGIYSKQIAETKVQESTQLARSEGHPLQVSMEPAEE